MRLTKHEHAYVTLEDQGQKLIIDPGTLTNDVGDITHVTTVVITHSHFDHLSVDHIAAIARANPSVKIFSTQTVAAKLPGMPVTIVTGSQSIEIGLFKLTFYGEKHAFIHDTTPDESNIGVLVNNTFYYAGDSYALPGAAVKTLAVPVSGPWVKISESIDFMAAIRPTLSIPIHDALLTPVGEKVAEDWLTLYGKQLNVPYRHVAVGESIEI